MVASSLPLSTSQARRQLQDQLAATKRRNAQIRGGAATLLNRLDAVARRGFQVPQSTINTRDQLLRLLSEMDQREAAFDARLVEAARTEERSGSVPAGTVDRILRSGVGEPLTILGAVVVLGIVAILGATVFFIVGEWRRTQPAIDTAAANVAAQQLLLGPIVADHERRLAATPTNQPPPPAPSIPGIPNPPSSGGGGFGTEIARGAGGIALLALVLGGLFIASRR